MFEYFLYIGLYIGSKQTSQDEDSLFLINIIFWQTLVKPLVKRVYSICANAANFTASQLTIDIARTTLCGVHNSTVFSKYFFIFSFTYKLVEIKFI